MKFKELKYNHWNLLIVLFALFCQSNVFAQTEIDLLNASIADCSGAMNITESGNYSIQFTGNQGNKEDLIMLPELSEISQKNLVWIAFTAENAGVVTFEAEMHQDYLQMVIFEDNAKNLCSNLDVGNAKTYRRHTLKTIQKIGLSEQLRDGFYFPIDLTAGQRIVVAFGTTEKSRAIMDLKFQFKERDENIRISNRSKIVNLLHNPTQPSIHFKIRDAETGDPIVADVLIQGAKELAALYKCSDLDINVNRACKVLVNCDAEGYFFLDQEINVEMIKKQEVVLKMDPIRKGKTMQIQEIEFKPGTSIFMPGAESKLIRLKDFMALNAKIEIEIQGHVFATGENKLQHQKMSEERAKKVMNFLVDNGIAKERMSAVGYGNTKPVFPNAKLPSEEQANRRVEILVK